MNNRSAITLNYKTTVLNIASTIFGIIVFSIGLVNTFWGNDRFFGIFLILLSFVYFPPVNVLIRKMLGFSIPLILKILLGIFIIIAALGVGELPAKIDMMLTDLNIGQ